MPPEGYRVRVGNRSAPRSATSPVVNVTTAKNYVGTFFENLAGAVLGAEEWPQGLGYIGHAGMHEPDLLLRDRAEIVEVKAARRSFKFHVCRAQLQAYEHATQTAAGPIDFPAVSYAFVSYQPKHKLTAYPRLGGLIDALAASIDYLAVLDISVVRAIGARFGCSKGYTTPLSPVLGKWEELFRVTPTRVRPFVDAPEEALAAYGLAATDYEIERHPAVSVDVSTAWPEASVRLFPYVRIMTPRTRRWEGPLIGASRPLIGDILW